MANESSGLQIVVSTIQSLVQAVNALAQTVVAAIQQLRSGAGNGVKEVSRTAYVLVASDAGKTIVTNNSAANSVTIPPSSSVAFPVDEEIGIVQIGTGQTQVLGGSGVTLSARGALSHVNGQFAVARIKQIATDQWILSGDIT